MSLNLTWAGDAAGSTLTLTSAQDVYDGRVKVAWTVTDPQDVAEIYAEWRVGAGNWTPDANFDGSSSPGYIETTGGSVTVRLRIMYMTGSYGSWVEKSLEVAPTGD